VGRIGVEGPSRSLCVIPQGRAANQAQERLYLPDRENDVGEKQDHLILPHQLTVLPAAAFARFLGGLKNSRLERVNSLYL